VFVGKCSCGFVDSFFNMAMDVDDFDHFPVEPINSEDGQFVLLLPILTRS
jgi:hypothetical protein